jgi:uncharacterized protein (TIGR03437 family)
MLPAQVNVLTANYDNNRTNANLQETTLTTANVSQATFGKLGSFPVDGQVYAQPLYVSSLTIPNSGTHNVLLLASMHNSVYAYDADSAGTQAPLWQVNLGPSVPTTLFSTADINPEIGILSTPVIDPTASVIYAVAETYENGSCVYRLHALDLATGQERLNGPAVISSTIAGSGAGTQDGVTLPFDPFMHLQRPGLLLVNGAIYIAFGSHRDQGSWHGWMISYNAADISKQLGVFNTTPNDFGGAIWQSGHGLAADDKGSIYAISGNGDYDGLTNFSQSFFKLNGQAPVLTDWYTPPNWQTLSDGDYDLSAGVALIPGTHMLIGGDKNGTLYLVNGDSMGGLDPGNSPNAQRFQGVLYGGIFTLALWNRPDAAYVYVQEQGTGVKSYEIVNGSFNTTPFAVGTVGVDIPFDGIAVSANGGQDGTGVLWETTGDHSNPIVPGTLHAFDASNPGHELWNSGMVPTRDQLGSFAKFVSPTVVNGNVYVPTFSNTVAVYGLLPSTSTGGSQSTPVISAVANAASYVQNSVSPGEEIMVFGTNVGPSSSAGLQVEDGFLTTSLAGARVFFDGIAAPMVSAGPNQVTAIAPFELTPGSTQVQIEFQGQSSPPVTLIVAPATPGLFSANGSGSGQGLILNHNGTGNSVRNAAQLGSVITLFATGAGQTTPVGQDGAIASGGSLPQPVLPVSVQIDGQPAQVIYAGAAPGLVQGILQINVVVPTTASVGATVPVFLQVGTALSQPDITVALQPARRESGPINPVRPH